MSPGCFIASQKCLRQQRCTCSGEWETPESICLSRLCTRLTERWPHSYTFSPHVGVNIGSYRELQIHTHQTKLSYCTEI